MTKFLLDLSSFQPNLTARHLLEKNKGRPSSRTKNLSLVSSPSRGKATSTPTLRRGPGSRRKGPGQFSITTALNTLNRMVHSPSGRHMVEISTPVLISSSNPSVITQHVEKADASPSSVGQVGNKPPGEGHPGVGQLVHTMSQAILDTQYLLSPYNALMITNVICIICQSCLYMISFHP